MTGPLTTISAVTVTDFLAAFEPPPRRADALVLEALFARVTGAKAMMWGPSMIGYGRYQYRYASGHGGMIFRAGFSPRKAKHSLYLLDCADSAEAATFAALLDRLGKHARGKSCVYVNKLADIDLAVLEEMVALTWQRSFQRHPG